MASSDWSTLALDLLGYIAIKLETIEDFIYFSTVCRSWNCASSSIKHQWSATPVPWLLLVENTKDNPTCICKIVNVSNNKCYTFTLPETFGKRCWGSAYGWIAMLNADYNVQLFNPITKASIRFPSLETVTPESPRLDKKGVIGWFTRVYFTNLTVLKTPRSSGQYEFVIMAVYDFGKRLAFARCEDESWTSVFVESKFVNFHNFWIDVCIVDVVGMNDSVFALYDDGEIIYWNVKELQGIIQPWAYSPSGYEIFEEDRRPLRYMVQSGNDLLMLLRYKEQVSSPDDHNNYNRGIVYRTICIHVYKFDSEEKRWKKIENVGDVALFVGCNSSKSISVLKATGLQRNCVYFIDENVGFTFPLKLGGYDMSVYDIKSDEISRFYKGDDTLSSTCPLNWFIPQL